MPRELFAEDELKVGPRAVLATAPRRSQEPRDDPASAPLGRGRRGSTWCSELRGSSSPSQCWEVCTTSIGEGRSRGRSRFRWRMR